MEKQKCKMDSLPTIEQVAKERRRIKHRAAYWKALRSTVNVLIVVASLAVLISSLFLPVLQISGNSMEPTLKDGEIIVLMKTEQFDTGELCSFTWNNKTLIKRIIAGPGEWVDIDSEGVVYINGEVLVENYITEKSLGECDIEFPYQVSDNHFFVLGDHRNTSVDSRSSVIGSVSKDQIIGKVFFRIWPLTEIGFIKQ